jgi:hypothetical protein
MATSLRLGQPCTAGERAATLPRAVKCYDLLRHRKSDIRVGTLIMQVVPEAQRSSTVATGGRDLTPVPSPSRPEDTLEDEIDFSRYFRVFTRHWMLLVVAAIAGGVLGFAVSRFSMRASLPFWSYRLPK